ncbi:unnamed protein product [Gadus morhua 'NCC']
MPPRTSPLTDARHHVGLKSDKTWKLEVKFINAVKDIKEGEEIAYNYGGEDCPWRKQIATCKPDTPCVSSNPVLMSKQLWDKAAMSEETGQQMATGKPDTPCVSSNPVLMSKQLWDKAAMSEETGQQKKFWVGVRRICAERKKTVHQLFRNHHKRKPLETRRGIKSQQNREANCHQQKMEHLLQSVLCHLVAEIRQHILKHQYSTAQHNDLPPQHHDQDDQEG